MTDFLKEITLILAEYSTIPVEQIVQEDALDEIDIDSLSLVEIIFDLEERFDIKIPDEEDISEMGMSMKNVGNVVKLVEHLVAEKEA